MKLLKVLSVAVLGTLLAVGCTVTTTETSGDGGTSGTDSGVKDTGSPGTDSGAKPDTNTTTDTGGGMTCEACQTAATSAGGKCEAETKACSTSAASAGCKALIDCLNACSDATCQNKCITDSTSAEGKAFVNCIFTECATACGG